MVLILGLTFSYGAFTEKKVTASQQTEQRMAAEKFVHMSATEYGYMRGKKLNFFERIAFHSAQHRMEKQLKKAENLTEGFNLGGFILGLLLGLLGVLLAYIFSQDANLRKWTWIGWGVWVVILLLVII